MIEVRLCTTALDAKEGNFMAPSCRHESDTAHYYQALDIRLLGSGTGGVLSLKMSACVNVVFMKSGGGRRGVGVPVHDVSHCDCVAAAVTSKNKGVFMSSLTDLVFINVLPPFFSLPPPSASTRHSPFPHYINSRQPH